MIPVDGHPMYRMSDSKLIAKLMANKENQFVILKPNSIRILANCLWAVLQTVPNLLLKDRICSCPENHDCPNSSPANKFWTPEFAPTNWCCVAFHSKFNAEFNSSKLNYVYTLIDIFKYVQAVTYQGEISSGEKLGGNFRTGKTGECNKRIKNWWRYCRIFKSCKF